MLRHTQGDEFMVDMIFCRGETEVDGCAGGEAPPEPRPALAPAGKRKPSR